MEISDAMSIWQVYNAKLERTLNLNQQILESIQLLKVKSKLIPIFWLRIGEIILHASAIILLLIFLIDNILQLPYAVNALLLIAFYLTLFFMCLKQINIIKRMDYSKDIVSIQSSLSILQTNIFNYFRLAVLFLPSVLAYPVVVTEAIKDYNLKIFGDFDIIAQSNGNWWTVQIIATAVLIPLCIWSYRQLSYKNIHKKWVRFFIQNSSGKRVRKIIEFIKELEDLK